MRDSLTCRPPEYRSTRMDFHKHSARTIYHSQIEILPLYSRRVFDSSILSHRHQYPYSNTYRTTSLEPPFHSLPHQTHTLKHTPHLSSLRSSLLHPSLLHPTIPSPPPKTLVPATWPASPPPSSASSPPGPRPSPAHAHHSNTSGTPPTPP